MPSWLVKLLQEQDGAYKSGTRLDNHGKLYKVKWRPNMARGIIPVLEQLIDQDVYVEFAYLCDPEVKHVSKLKREGRSQFFLPLNTSTDLNRWILWLSEHPNDVFVHYWC